MAVFFNRFAFIKEFNQCLAAGYKFYLENELGSEDIATAEEFMQSAAYSDCCYLMMETKQGKPYCIAFTTEYLEEIQDDCIKFYDYSDSETFKTLFKEFLLVS